MVTKKCFFLLTLLTPVAMLIGFFEFVSLVSAQERNGPKEMGVFYKAGNTWTKLGNAYPSDAKTKQSVGGVFTHSYTNILIFDNAESETRVADKRAVFYFAYPAGVEVYRKVHSFFQFQICRLEKRPDHRELITKGSTGLLGGFSGIQADKKYVVAINVQSVSDGLLSITPVSELQPGEYVLVKLTKGGDTPEMFEFGVVGP